MVKTEELIKFIRKNAGSHFSMSQGTGGEASKAGSGNPASSYEAPAAINNPIPFAGGGFQPSSTSVAGGGSSGALADQNAGGQPIPYTPPPADSHYMGQYGTNADGVPMIGHPDPIRTPSALATTPSSTPAPASQVPPKDDLQSYDSPGSLPGNDSSTLLTGQNPHGFRAQNPAINNNPAPAPAPYSIHTGRGDVMIGAQQPESNPTTPNYLGGRGHRQVNPAIDTQVPGTGGDTNEIVNQIQNQPMIPNPGSNMHPNAAAGMTQHKPQYPTALGKTSSDNELNNTQNFVIGFIKKAMYEGFNEEEAIVLLKESSTIAPPDVPNASNISSNLNAVMGGKFGGGMGAAHKPTPGPSSQGVANGVAQLSQQTPAYAHPVQAAPALNTAPVQPQPQPNLGNQDLQQFEQSRSANLNSGSNPQLNGQVDQQLTSLPPLQAQQLIGYLQSKLHSQPQPGQAQPV